MTRRRKNYHYLKEIFFLVFYLLCITESTFGEEYCGFPGSPAHSSIYFTNTSLSIGTIATYSCERGFELLGPSRRVCNKGGIWNPEGMPFCVLNIAAGKAPMQISTELTGVPQKAVDGSTSSFFNAETCTLTKPERVPWWYVNLLEPYMVQLVRLDFGKPCCGKNKPATIVVRVGNNQPDLGKNPICNRFTGFIEEGKPLFLPCNPPMPGAFVTVHLESSATQNQLSICEAFVYTDQALPIEGCPQFRDQPPGSTATYNGKCYTFYNRHPLSWKDALSFCRSRGGTLIDETNPALQGFISWELWRRHRTDSNSQYWMGAVRDPLDGNNWKWINGNDVTVSFWHFPSGNEDCARFDGSEGWLWSNSNCQLQSYFICQHQPKSCGRPEQPPNSTMIAENFDVGTTVEYNCDEGHLLVGPTTRICLPTGFYNEFPPVCKNVQCGYPADIQNGGYHLVNDSVSYLSQVVYKCNDGFKIQGRAELTCDLDERWDGPPPRCIPVKCPHPPEIANGAIVMSNNVTDVGTIIEYACESSKFRLVGSKQLRCLPSGNYDNSPPVCKDETKTTHNIPSLMTTKFVTPTAPSSISTIPHVTISNAVTSSTIRTTPREKPRPFSPPQNIATKTVTGIGVSSSVSTTDNYLLTADDIIRSEDDTRFSAPSSHPQDNEIPDSVRFRSNVNAVNVPPSHSIEDDRSRETIVSKLNIGAIIALGVFGAFVFLAAVVTTVVLLIRRNRSATTKHYLHRPSPDSNTMASYTSSSSESRAGLSRYYRQAWENLHQSANGKTHHQPVRRKETLDPRLESMRSGSELMVSDMFPPKSSNEKKKHHHHHHHHHHHDDSRDLRYNHQSNKKSSPRY